MVTKATKDIRANNFMFERNYRMGIILIILGILCLAFAVNSPIYIVFSLVLIIWGISLKKTSKQGTGIKNPSQSEMKRIFARFDNNPLVKQATKDIRANNYLDYDYRKGGICVCEDCLKTPSRTYKYADYNLSNIDINSCRDLAFYFGHILPKGIQFSVRKETTQTLSKGTTYYYETPGGHLESGGGNDVSVELIGYSVYRKDSKPNAKQQDKGEKW